MIFLNDVYKAYQTRSGVHQVLDGVNLTIRSGEKIGILGRNGAGKSTLIRILSGAERPDSGKVERGMKMSWPLAFGGAFQGSLTGLDNLRFICRVYEADFSGKVEYVKDFAELGKYFWEPVKTYSSGMRSRLAFAISMAIEFDCFLIDEVISVGDARFHEKCREELFIKRKDRAFVMVSHELHNLQEFCGNVYVLYQGKLLSFDEMSDAYDFYNGNC
ncbi:ABC transporter ATP-binding protein [Comamonas sp. HJ-2]